MYVTTDKGLGQEPLLSGPFGGLGTSSFPVGIQKLIDAVSKSPKNYKPLLLAVYFDHFPGYRLSKDLIDILDKLKLTSDDAYAALISNIRLPQIINKLWSISENLRKQDPGFQRLIDAERKLRNEMLRTVDGIKDKKAFELFYLKASLISPWAEDVPLSWLGDNFASQMLPPKLYQRLEKSAVKYAHYSALGYLLQGGGRALQGKDPAFKQRVEQEKKPPRP